MTTLKSIELHMEDTKDLALIGSDESIWIVVPLRWWDLATFIWWYFVPFDKKRKVALTMGDGSKVSFRAVRVASRYVRVRNFTARPL